MIGHLALGVGVEHELGGVRGRGEEQPLVVVHFFKGGLDLLLRTGRAFVVLCRRVGSFARLARFACLVFFFSSVFFSFFFFRHPATASCDPRRLGQEQPDFVTVLRARQPATLDALLKYDVDRLHLLARLLKELKVGGGGRFQDGHVHRDGFQLGRDALGDVEHAGVLAHAPRHVGVCKGRFDCARDVGLGDGFGCLGGGLGADQIGTQPAKVAAIGRDAHEAHALHDAHDRRERRGQQVRGVDRVVAVGVGIHVVGRHDLVENRMARQRVRARPDPPAHRVQQLVFGCHRVRVATVGQVEDRNGRRQGRRGRVGKGASRSRRVVRWQKIVSLRVQVFPPRRGLSGWGRGYTWGWRCGWRCSVLVAGRVRRPLEALGSERVRYKRKDLLGAVGHRVAERLQEGLVDGLQLRLARRGVRGDLPLLGRAVAGGRPVAVIVILFFAELAPRRCVRVKSQRLDA